MSVDDQPRALVLAPAPGIGDFIVRVPAIRLLAESHQVTLISSLPETMRAFGERLIDHRADLRFIAASYRKDRVAIARSHVTDLVAALRARRRYELMLLLVDDNSRFGATKLGLMSLLAAKSSRRYAIAQPGRWFPAHRGIEVQAECQKMEKYFRVTASVLGQDRLDWRSFMPARRELQSDGTIVVAPGGKYEHQRWPLFSELVDWLVRQGKHVTVVGSADEATLLQRVAGAQAQVRCGLGLEDVRRIVGASAALVCNDSGLLHLGVWQRVPVLAVCGPRFAARWTGYPEDLVKQIYAEGEAGGEDRATRLAAVRSISLHAVQVAMQKVLATDPALPSV